MKVNMTPNPLDVVTIHASQGDSEARQWEFELHNNGELIDTSEITEQLFFKAYKGGTEQLLPENTSTPTTSPFLGDIRYPQGLLTDQEFTYRQSPTEEDGLAKITDIKGNTLVWNQIYNVNSDRTALGVNIKVVNGAVSITGTSTGTRTGPTFAWTDFKAVIGHKYIITKDFTLPNGDYIFDQYNLDSSTDITTVVFTATNSGEYIIPQLRVAQTGVTYNISGHLCVYDLTKMLGSGNEPSTVEEFTSLFPLSYYSYNQGSLLSFMGNGIKTVGKNQLNLGDSKSATANGVTASYDASTQKVTLSGTNTKTDSAYILINFTPSAIPKFKIGETYVVSASSQIPTNTYFNLVYRDTNNALQGLSLTQIETRRAWRFTVPSNYSTFNAFQIGILKEARQLNGEFGIQLEFGSTATTYEPYTSSLLNLPISTYFPSGMKSAGNVYDELTESKAKTRVKQIIFDGSSDENWNVVISAHRAYIAVSDIDTSAPDTSVGNIMSNIYASGAYSRGAFDNIITTRYGIAQINIFDSVNITSSSTTATWRAYLQDHPLVVNYAISTPIETSFTTASLVTENAEIPLSNNDGVLIGKCTEQLSENPGFIDAKIKLSDEDGECYSNKLQLHVERSPQ